MFNLDSAITDWRRQMLAAGLKSPVPLDELEGHLRDDIQEQMRSGIEAQQAFEAAIEQVGQACALKAEFEKAGEARRTRERRLLGVFMMGFACFYALFVSTCVIFKLGSFSDVVLKEQTSALLATTLTVLLMVSGRFGQRFFPVIAHKRTRVGIYAAGVVLLFAWLSIFYYLVMVRFEFNLSQFLVAFLWAWIPMGALCGAISGMEQAALQKTTATES